MNAGSRAATAAVRRRRRSLVGGKAAKLVPDAWFATVVANARSGGSSLLTRTPTPPSPLPSPSPSLTKAMAPSLTPDDLAPRRKRHTNPAFDQLLGPLVSGLRTTRSRPREPVTIDVTLDAEHSATATSAAPAASPSKRTRDRAAERARLERLAYHVALERAAASVVAAAQAKGFAERYEDPVQAAPDHAAAPEAGAHFSDWQRTMAELYGTAPPNSAKLRTPAIADPNAAPPGTIYVSDAEAAALLDDAALFEEAPVAMSPDLDGVASTAAPDAAEAAAVGAEAEDVAAPGFATLWDLNTYWLDTQPATPGAPGQSVSPERERAVGDALVRSGAFADLFRRLQGELEDLRALVALDPAAAVPADASSAAIPVPAVAAVVLGPAPAAGRTPPTELRAQQRRFRDFCKQTLPDLAPLPPERRAAVLWQSWRLQRLRDVVNALADFIVVEGSGKEENEAKKVLRALGLHTTDLHSRVAQDDGTRIARFRHRSRKVQHAIRVGAARLLGLRQL